MCVCVYLCFMHLLLFVHCCVYKCMIVSVIVLIAIMHFCGRSSLSTKCKDFDQWQMQMINSVQEMIFCISYKSLVLSQCSESLWQCNCYEEHWCIWTYKYGNVVLPCGSMMQQLLEFNYFVVEVYCISDVN